MEDINKIIGKNLLILRKNAKLTQMELAERFNYSDKTISKWESGESMPSIEILYELAKFYNTTLDALTVEGDILATTKSEPKPKNKLFPTRLIITLLAVSAVWLCATILFVCFKIIYETNYGMFFLWAIPISCVVLLIFNSIWGRSYLLFWILSVLIWSTLMCIHLQLIQYNIWIIYILGIPLQVAVILWAALLKKPHSNKRKKKKLDDKSVLTKESNTNEIIVEDKKSEQNPNDNPIEKQK